MVPLESPSNRCIHLCMCVHSKGKHKTASVNLRMLRALFYEAASWHQPRSYSSTMRRSLKTLIRPSIFYLLITWSSSGLESLQAVKSFCSVDSRSFHSIKTVGSNTEFALKGNENGIRVSKSWGYKSGELFGSKLWIPTTNVSRQQDAFSISNEVFRSNPSLKLNSPIALHAFAASYCRRVFLCPLVRQ